MVISYGVTVCDEHEELLVLLEFLKKYKDTEDEIVVVYDQNRVTTEVMCVLTENKDHIAYYPFNFQQNFLENKNYLNTKCNGDFIFQLDSDETPAVMLITHLKQILVDNNVDVLITPRKNLVEGLGISKVLEWKWNISKLENHIDEKIFDLDNPNDRDEYELLKKSNLIIEETIQD